jgi:hypothetical protein
MSQFSARSTSILIANYSELGIGLPVVGSTSNECTSSKNLDILSNRVTQSIPTFKFNLSRQIMLRSVALCLSAETGSCLSPRSTVLASLLRNSTGSGSIIMSQSCWPKFFGLSIFAGGYSTGSGASSGLYNFSSVLNSDITRFLPFST